MNFEGPCRILVLGGGGFIGSPLCRALASAGHTVRVFGRTDPGASKCLIPGIDRVIGDFLNPASVEMALEGCEVVFHLISTTVPKSSNENPVFDLKTNLLATVELLEMCRRSGVRKIIYASSGGTVYGVPHDDPISELHPTRPICAYGVSKLAVENYLELYRMLHGLEYCVLRISNPYGPGQGAMGTQGAIAVFVRRALRGENIEVWGDGSVVRDYVYIDDVVEAFMKTIFADRSQRVFNVGSGRGSSVRQILGLVEELTGVEMNVVYRESRWFDVPRNVLDVTRAAVGLDWRPNIELEDGLSRTIAWTRSSR